MEESSRRAHVVGPHQEKGFDVNTRAKHSAESSKSQWRVSLTKCLTRRNARSTLTIAFLSVNRERSPIPTLRV